MFVGSSVNVTYVAVNRYTVIVKAYNLVKTSIASVTIYVQQVITG